VLTIAGSDPSSGAGVQADLKAIEANGGYGATAITAVTVQNTCGVQRSVSLEPDLVRDQIAAVLDDLPVAAVKSGMLGDERTVAAVAELLAAWRPRPYVLDPVVAARDGFNLLEPAALRRLERELIPRATLLTPNVEDVRALTGRSIRDVAGAERAGRALLELGCEAVLVKGGHLAGDGADDVLVSEAGTRVFEGRRIDSPHTHGTGCVYGAAIATRLACGESVESAVATAKAFVSESIRHGLDLGHGCGPTDPLHRLHRQPGSEVRR
jgi:hydroxymethylpyrimidine/phosphomethylpyrimidine kinase